MNTLRQAIDEYIGMRRNLGFKLKDTQRSLLEFAAFMEQRQAPFITEALALAWAQQPVNVQPAHWARRLSDVRIFARYRKGADPRTEIPSPGLLPFRPKRAKPYLYSDREIQDLLRAARNLSDCGERSALRPWVYYCLYGLLSVTGLRVGEARSLELTDVDLDAVLLTVRHAKFDRVRLAPLHRSTCEVLADYIARRQHHWAGRQVSPWLFVSSRGNQLDASDIRRTFYALSRQIGLRGANDSHGPRLHDFRHRFATKTLVNWYRHDQDPERLLPVLATYLGHVHIADTHWYLEASPELMGEAMRRLERRWESRS